MQPTTPFNAKSPIAIASEVLGWGLLAITLYGGRLSQLPWPAALALLGMIVAFVFVRFCSLRRWHPNAAPDEGLGRQFQQILVPSRALFACGTTIALIQWGFPLLYISSALLIIVALINATLIYIYTKDPSTVPVNLYSHRKTVEE